LFAGVHAVELLVIGLTVVLGVTTYLVYRMVAALRVKK